LLPGWPWRSFYTGNQTERDISRCVENAQITFAVGRRKVRFPLDILRQLRRHYQGLLKLPAAGFPEGDRVVGGADSVEDEIVRRGKKE
jgi:hypothetical protein